MSSMASSCDHVDHVRTQLPYALFGAVIALAAGYIPAMVFGVPVGLTLVVGLAAILLAIRFIAKPIRT